MQLAVNVPRLVTSSHVALVVMVAEVAQLTANVKQRIYLNINAS